MLFLWIILLIFNCKINNIENIKSHYELQDMLLYVCIEICNAIQDEFKQYLHLLLPKLLIIFKNINNNNNNMLPALNALTIFGNNL